MKEVSIIELKDELSKEIIKVGSGSLKGFSVNRMCDDILSNYISFCLYSEKRGKSRDCLLEFIRSGGDLDAKIFKFIYDHQSIPELLLKYDLYRLVQDPYSLAKTYEEMKSYIIKISGGEITPIRSLDYRKSAGMFFTAREIVRFIVENTLEDKKREIMEMIERGEHEAAIERLLELGIVDIACGTGSFLTEAIEILKEIRNEIINQVGKESLVKINNGKLIVDEREFLNNVIKKSIYGVDMDRNATLLCAYNVWHTSFANMTDQEVYRWHIRTGDSLTGDAPNRRGEIKEPYLEMWRGGFNWPSEFYKVFSRDNPGFDIVIMNPPYGKVRLESHKGHNKNNEIGKEEREAMKTLATYFRECGMYSLSTYGVLNFYKLMIERALAIMRRGGSVGFIVPSTLLCDRSTAKIRKRLFNGMSTKIIVEVPENSDFFEDVTQSFCIVISSVNGVSKNIGFKGDVKNRVELESNDFIDVDVDFIRKKFPDMLYVPLTDKTGIQIFNKIHNYGKLSDYGFIKNSRGEVDLTKFSNIISTDNRLKKLIRGNNIEKYKINDDVKTKPSFIDENELKKGLGDSAKLGDIAKTRLVCKQIANQNKKSRLEFAMVPPNSILANSCNYITIYDHNDPNIMRYLLGFLNSSIVEWRFRITSTNNHINNYEIDALPLIVPKRGSPQWSVVGEIAESVRKIESNPHSDEMSHLSAEIDWNVFKLFGLSMDEIKYILSRIGKDDEYMRLVMKHAEPK